MSLSKQGILEICQYEGLCLRIYYDSRHILTFGFGSTVTEIPNIANWDKTKYHTIQEAVDIFEKSLSLYEKDINTHCTHNLQQYQYDALVSICYNIGCNGLNHSTFLADINSCKSISTVKKAILMWDRPPEIMGRRMKEASLFSDGKYTADGYVEYEDTDGNGYQLHKTIKQMYIANQFN